MHFQTRWVFFLSILAILVVDDVAAQAVVPGGLGFGINTPAGRGGQIHRVTNLNDVGEGSLRNCVESSGPRTCIFEVSGTITLTTNLVVSDPNLTIAGQTAPSPGIELRGASLAIRASDVLVQHLTVRVGDDPLGPPKELRDAVKIGGNSYVQNVVIDHCSLSWAVDEIIEVWSEWDNVTVSNSILSEPLTDAGMPDGKSHGYGALIDATPGRISFIGNIFAHAHNRNPRSAAEGLIFVNNVVYNGGAGNMTLFNKDGLATRNSIVGNVFIDGPDSTGAPAIKLSGQNDGDPSIPKTVLSASQVYLDDNLAGDSSSNPWAIVLNLSGNSDSELRAENPPIWLSGLTPMRTQNGQVEKSVLGNAGSRPADRNAVDSRVIQSIRNRTGRHINCVFDDGSERCSANAGGWPFLTSNLRRLDLPTDPNGDDDRDGYTNVEEWLHSLASDVEGQQQVSNSVAPMPPLLTD